MYKFLDGKSYLLGAQSNKKDIERLKVDVENLKDAARGKLYNEQVLTADSYSDVAYASTVPFATLDKVGGKTLVWNNVAAPLTTEYWTFEGNVSGTFNDDGSVTFTNTVKNYGMRTRANRPAVSNHKMYISALVKSEVASGNNAFKIGFGNSSLNFDGYPTMTRYAAIGNINQPSNSVIYVWYADTTGTITVKDLCMVDLTVMFGAGNEPTGVSDARIAMIDSIFAAHPEHSEPTLMDFSTDTIVSKGRNLVIGKLAGHNISASGVVQQVPEFSLHYAPVKSGTTYTVHTDDLGGCICAFYTDVPALNMVSYNGARIVQDSKTVTAPITGYIAFRTSLDYAEAQISVGTTELPYLPHREPVTHDTSALARKYFPDGMKSAGAVHDELDLEHKVAIKRVGTGRFAQTLNWSLWKDNAYYATDCGIETVNDFVNTNITVESNYPSVNANDVYDQKAGIAVRLNIVYALGEMRDKIAGLKVNYALPEPVITPITEDIDTYIAVEGSGTVEFHNDKGDEYKVPVAHQMTYLTKVEV